MSDDFSSRARALAPRITADPLDPGITSELAALRDLWRSLSSSERAAASGPAQALAAAQLQGSLFDDERVARRALSGLDRINVDGARAPLRRPS